MTHQPLDLEAVAQRLQTAEPIEMALTPWRAYNLLALLQLALRHPGLQASDHVSAEVGRSMAKRLQEKLVIICPDLTSLLESGWHPDADCTAEEFDEFLETGEQPGKLYQHLRLDIQEEVLANSLAFGIAINIISTLTGNVPGDLIQMCANRANEVVNALSANQVRESILKIDLERDYDPEQAGDAT